MKSNSSNHTQCMFQVFRIDNKTLAYPFLDMYWSVLILSNLLLGISPLLVITTTFEFIPAQSPLYMKGLIIGVFFAIRDLLTQSSSFPIFLSSIHVAVKRCQRVLRSLTVALSTLSLPVWLD